MWPTSTHQALRKILMSRRSQKLSERCNDRQQLRGVMTRSIRWEERSQKAWENEETGEKPRNDLREQSDRRWREALGMNERRIRWMWPHQSIQEKVFIIVLFQSWLFCLENWGWRGKYVPGLIDIVFEAGLQTCGVEVVFFGLDLGSSCLMKFECSPNPFS